MLEISIEATKSAKKKRESQLNVHFSIMCLGGNLQQLEFFLCGSQTLLLLKDVFYI